MRFFLFIIILSFFLNINGFSQVQLPIEYRIEKQSMSTPMSVVEDIFFTSSYYTRPVNVKFDGAVLNLVYDNGATFTKRNVTKVNHEKEFEHAALSLETYYYTDNNNLSDTILMVIDYQVGYIQMILPTKNSKGEYIGYTSYRKFVKNDELALN